MNYIDIHTHLLLKDYNYAATPAARIATAIEHGVTTIITIGTDTVDNFTNRDCADQWAEVFFAVGIHPSECKSIAQVQADLALVAPLCAHPKAVAVGETGLDYYWTTETKEAQQASFEAHIALSQRENLPLIVHSREAWADTVDTLRRTKARGVIHCFTGTKDEAAAYLDLGFYISFPGIITFPKKIDALREAARFVPLDRIVLETDAPYLSPVPHRGKENQSAYMPHIYQALADIKGIDLATCCAQINENARRLFAL
ncbi:TatD family hydrolase [Chrysiogenes arsenatis]|uniref:TatD family hydrolase n=1 Tax=Chrysiogenes arsenatis TaxID=309797 RepID=UPI00041501AE|nr:TatD family hydrolase [Chrysiogenes arsenatis]